MDELEEQLPKNPQPGSSVIFPFEDGWIDSSQMGLVKISEVKYEYESKAFETIINLAANDFVEAILKDALDGQTDYVPKY